MATLLVYILILIGVFCHGPIAGRFSASRFSGRKAMASEGSEASARESRALCGERDSGIGDLRPSSEGDPGARFAYYAVFLGVDMSRPLKRYGVHKGRSARSFRKQSRRTKSPNMAGPNRGGWRL